MIKIARRTRAEIFQEVVERLKEDKHRIKAELYRDVLTDYELFSKIIEALKETSIVRSEYIFTPSGRQRELLIATDRIRDTERLVQALGRVIAPNLKTLFETWYFSKHPIRDRRTIEELEKDKENKRTFNLVRKLFPSEREQEELHE